MLHTKFRGNRATGSGEDFEGFFTIYGHGGHLGHVTHGFYYIWRWGTSGFLKSFMLFYLRGLLVDISPRTPLGHMISSMLIKFSFPFT